MSVQYDADVNAIGGGGFGGGFGGGNSLLWFLLILFGLDKRGGGFGGDGGAGAGVLAGETQAKLDCLSQNQMQMMNQISDNAQSERFFQLQQQITSGIDQNRNGQTVINGQLNDLSRQLASCCCDIKTGQVSIENAIAMQTNQLNVINNANTQKVLDAINAQNVSALEAVNADLRAQLNRRETVADITSACGCCSGSCGGGGNNIDINVLARALAVQNNQ